MGCFSFLFPHLLLINNTKGTFLLAILIDKHHSLALLKNLPDDFRNYQFLF